MGGRSKSKWCKQITILLLPIYFPLARSGITSPSKNAPHHVYVQYNTIHKSAPAAAQLSVRGKVSFLLLCAEFCRRLFKSPFLNGDWGLYGNGGGGREITLLMERLKQQEDEDDEEDLNCLRLPPLLIWLSSSELVAKNKWDSFRRRKSLLLFYSSFKVSLSPFSQTQFSE